MKNLFLIFYILFFSMRVFSQTIDSAEIIIIYNLKYLPDSANRNRYLTDILFLQKGEKTSSFFSYNKFRRDSLFQESDKNGTQRDLIKNSNLRNQFGVVGPFSNSVLFINYPEKKITITDEIIGGTKFIYEETMEKIDWIISSDTMSILNYICQKATATFRGRNYTGWFSAEIPLDAGPYKFRGLPGLILKISDNNNNYIYECIGINRFSKKRPIILSDKQYIKTSRNEFRKIFKETFANPFELLKVQGVSVSIVGGNSNNTSIQTNKGIPFNPIELE